MVLLNPEIYEKTKQIVLGKIEKSALLTEFADWLGEKFSVNLINFEYDRIDNPQRSYRLYLILNSKSDKEKFFSKPFVKNRKYEKAVSNHFRLLAQKHGYSEQQALEKFFVAYSDFSEEAKTLANWQAVEKAKPIIKQACSEVWEVMAMFSSTVVFYYLDSQIHENAESGVSGSISEDYFQILKKFDELDYYTSGNFTMKFDSKENVDQNYQGSLFYYSR